MDDLKFLIDNTQKWLDYLIDSAEHAQKWLREIKNPYSDLEVKYIKEYTDAVESLSKNVSGNVKKMQKAVIALNGHKTCACKSRKAKRA